MFTFLWLSLNLATFSDNPGNSGGCQGLPPSGAESASPGLKSGRGLFGMHRDCAIVKSLNSLKGQERSSRPKCTERDEWSALFSHVQTIPQRADVAAGFLFQPSSSTPDLTHLINWSQSSESWLVKLCALDWLEQKSAATWPFVE